MNILPDKCFKTVSWVDRPKSYIITHGSLLQLLLEHGDLLNIDISQGSVAKHLRCGGYLNISFCCKFTTGSASEFWKLVNTWGTYGQEFIVLFFDSRCISFKIVRDYLFSVSIFISKVPSFYASNSSFFHRVLDLMTFWFVWFPFAINY